MRAIQRNQRLVAGPLWNVFSSRMPRINFAVRFGTNFAAESHFCTCCTHGTISSPKSLVRRSWGRQGLARAFTTSTHCNDLYESSNPVETLKRAAAIADELVMNHKRGVSEHDAQVTDTTLHVAEASTRSNRQVASNTAVSQDNAMEKASTLLFVSQQLVSMQHIWYNANGRVYQEYAADMTKIHHAFLVVFGTCLDVLENHLQQQHQQQQQDMDSFSLLDHDVNGSPTNTLWQMAVDVTRRAHELQFALQVPLHQRFLALVPHLEKNSNKAMECVKEHSSQILVMYDRDGLESVLQTVILKDWVPPHGRHTTLLSLQGLMLAVNTVEWCASENMIVDWKGDWAIDVVVALRDRLLPYANKDLVEMPGAVPCARLVQLLEPTLFRITQTDLGVEDAVTATPPERELSHENQDASDSGDSSTTSTSSSSSSSSDDKSSGDVDTEESSSDGDPVTERIQTTLTQYLKHDAVSSWVCHWVKTSSSWLGSMGNDNKNNSNEDDFDDFFDDDSDDFPPVPMVIEVPVQIFPDGSSDFMSQLQKAASLVNESGFHSDDEFDDTDDIYQLWGIDPHVPFPDVREQWKTWTHHNKDTLRYSKTLERILYDHLYPERARAKNTSNTSGVRDGDHDDFGRGSD